MIGRLREKGYLDGVAPATPRCRNLKARTRRSTRFLWSFSHSYLFGAIPFTHAGAIVAYSLNEQLTPEGGVGRGWDDALEDKNDAMDFLLERVVYQAGLRTSLQLAVTGGPEHFQFTAALDAIYLF